MVRLVSYYLINLKYPQVRKEEYLTIPNKNIKACTLFPVADPIIKLQKDNKVGLSFINLHHKTDKEIQTLIHLSSFSTIHIFEVAKDTVQSIFLDKFISKYKHKEHRGNYLNVNNYRNVTQHDTLNYKWHLDEVIAHEYLTALFRLDRHPSLDLLNILNYDGKTLDWSLDYIKLEK